MKFEIRFCACNARKISFPKKKLSKTVCNIKKIYLQENNKISNFDKIIIKVFENYLNPSSGSIKQF